MMSWTKLKASLNRWQKYKNINLCNFAKHDCRMILEKSILKFYISTSKTSTLYSFFSTVFLFSMIPKLIAQNWQQNFNLYTEFKKLTFKICLRILKVQSFFFKTFFYKTCYDFFIKLLWFEMTIVIFLPSFLEIKIFLKIAFISYSENYWNISNLELYRELFIIKLAKWLV